MHMAHSKGDGARGIKSRLCTRFMQTGKCNYGDECKFAHGYDELARDGPRMPMDGAGFDAFRAGMMMPGGPMLPPEFMMGGMMGMAGPIMPPRPPPGPPPAAPHPSEMTDPRQTPTHSPMTGNSQHTHVQLGGRQEFGMYSQSSALEDTADVPYRDRIRALCLMMSVGKAKREDVKQGAAEAAIASVRSGEAFHGNVYSDSMEYVH